MDGAEHPEHPQFESLHGLAGGVYRIDSRDEAGPVVLVDEIRYQFLFPRSIGDRQLPRSAGIEKKKAPG
jgi:hypothetical protein